MMDQWKPEGFCQSIQADITCKDLEQSTPDLCMPSHGLRNSHLESSQRAEVEVKNSTTAKKVQKADCKKLRRDRLNEQFLELGNALGGSVGQKLADRLGFTKEMMVQIHPDPIY